MKFNKFLLIGIAVLGLAMGNPANAKTTVPGLSTVPELAQNDAVVAPVAGLLVSADVAANAPTQTSTTPGTNFLNSLAWYFTGSNTNFDMHSTVEVTMSAVYQDGIGIGNDFGIRYKYDLGTNYGLLAESVTRNAGVAGVIVSEQAGVGLYFIKHDIELSGGVDFGYRFDVDRPALTLYADVRKSLTENTYAGLRLAFETDFSSASPSAPEVDIETGFKF